MRQGRVLIALFTVLLITLMGTACNGQDEPEETSGTLPESVEDVSDEEPVDTSDESSVADRPEDDPSPTEIPGIQAALVVEQSLVEVQRSGDEDFEEVTGEVALGEGDSVRTGEEGVAIITFADGTQTYLYPDSALTVKTIEESESGGLVIWLEQTLGISLNLINSDNTDSHDVDTPYGVASVRGTVYWLEVDSDEEMSSFDVTKGAVDIDPYRDQRCDPSVEDCPQACTSSSDEDGELPLCEELSVCDSEDPADCPPAPHRVEAGRSADMGGKDGVRFKDDLDLTCEDDICYHPHIDELIEEGKLPPPGEDGGRPPYLPPDEDICDPHNEDCGPPPSLDDCDPAIEDCDDLPPLDDCDPAVEDCDDLPPLDDCDPAIEDCDDLPPLDDCDPAVEDCGDLPPLDDCDPAVEDCGDEPPPDDCDPAVEDCGDDLPPEDDPPPDDDPPPPPPDDDPPPPDDDPPDDPTGPILLFAGGFGLLGFALHRGERF